MAITIEEIGKREDSPNDITYNGLLHFPGGQSLGYQVQMFHGMFNGELSGLLNYSGFVGDLERAWDALKAKYQK